MIKLQGKKIGKIVKTEEAASASGLEHLLESIGAVLRGEGPVACRSPSLHGWRRTREKGGF